MQALARGADGAGADLRMMVLTRPVHSMVHEHLSASAPTVSRLEMYISSCTQLAYQLSRLDPRFFYCFPYDPDELDGEAAPASAFLGRSPEALMAAVRAVHRPSNHSRAWAALESAAALAPQLRPRFVVLRQCMQTLEDLLCARARAIHHQGPS